MSIASKGKGKSGGARVITYVFINHTTVFLLSVYDKSDQVDIGIKELHQLVKEIAQKQVNIVLNVKCCTLNERNITSIDTTFNINKLAN